MISKDGYQVALPDDLASPRVKLVYFTILVMDGATVSDLQYRLKLPKLTLLPILTSLTANDHIQRTENEYVCQ